MKNIWVFPLALTLCLAIGFAGTSFAGQLPSCEDLEQMADTLDEAAESLKTIGSIGRGSELDAALGQMINALVDVANVENNKDLIDAVNLMGTSWQNDDWSTMKEGLDEVIFSLDELIQRDCN